MPEAIPIGNKRQLFLDGYLIEWRDKMWRRVCPASKHPQNPVLRPEAAWEPIGYLTFGSVLYDEEDAIYKMWCLGMGGSQLEGVDHYQSHGVFYFTSRDGIRWERPELDVVSIAGQPTNIVALSERAQCGMSLPAFRELFGVSKDPHGQDPQRRYKLGYLYVVRDYTGPNQDWRHPGQLRGLAVAFSPDGIHWTPTPEPVTTAIHDGGTHWFRDPRTGRFRLYGRTQRFSEDVEALYGEDRHFQLTNAARAVNYVESQDFLNWEPEKGTFIIAADVLDGPNDEIYSMSVFPYEDVYIGLVQMFYNHQDDSWLDIQLAVSRDGIHFQRLSDRSPFIPRGQVGEWDRFNQSVANNEPIRVADELRFYYSGRDYRHSGVYKGEDNGSKAGLRYRAAVGIATTKQDRFAAMEASFDAGKLLTKPLILDGPRIHVNANVSFGSLEVTLLDPEGQPLERMQAKVSETDATDIPIPLDLSAFLGKPLRIQFTLANGQLYSFWTP